MGELVEVVKPKLVFSYIEKNISLKPLVSMGVTTIASVTTYITIIIFRG